MRLRVASLIAATMTAMTLWAGSLHAAQLVELPDGGKAERCRTIAGCTAATTYMLGVQSERELGTDRITIVTPATVARGMGLVIDFHRGDSLAAWIATGGRSGHAHYAGNHLPHRSLASRGHHHATRFAGRHGHAVHMAAHHARLPQTAAHHHAAPKAVHAIAAATIGAPIAAAKAAEPAATPQAAPATQPATTVAPATVTKKAETTSVATIPVPSVDAVAELKLNLEQANRKIAELQSGAQNAQKAAQAATDKAQALEPHVATLEKEIKELKATPPYSPVTFKTVWERTSPELLWTGLALLALFVGMIIALVVLAVVSARTHRRLHLLELAGGPDILVRHRVPSALADLEGETLPFTIDPPASYAGPTPVFDAVIDRVRPELRTIPGGATRVDTVLYGRAPWARTSGEAGYTDDLVELGYVDAEGELHIKPHGLTTQLGQGLNTEIGPRATLVKAWAERAGFRPARTNERFSVVPYEMRAAA